MLKRHLIRVPIKSTQMLKRDQQKCPKQRVIQERHSKQLQNKPYKQESISFLTNNYTSLYYMYEKRETLGRHKKVTSDKTNRQYLSSG